MPVIDAPASRSLALSLIAEHYAVRGRDLIAGGFTIQALTERFGTPLYIYDAEVLRRSFMALKIALNGFASIVYSIKANPNPAVACLFVDLGAGIEIASAGEYARARQAGAAPNAILFAGPGKRDDELAHVVQNGIGEIHLESLEEMMRLDAIAACAGTHVAVSLRINPVSAAQGGAMRMGGKPSPFGFDEERIDEVLRALASAAHLDLCGVHMFAGTQILDADTLLAQWRHGIDVAARVARATQRPLRSIDLGGGLGIPYYAGDMPLDLASIRNGTSALAAQKVAEPLLRDARVIVEPGRYLVIAPARMDATSFERVVVAGPLCTPLDTLARAADLPPLEAGDLVAVMQSGAYGLSASPVGFLSHKAPAEVLVDNGTATAI